MTVMLSLKTVYIFKYVVSIYESVIWFNKETRKNKKVYALVLAQNSGIWLLYEGITLIK